MTSEISATAHSLGITGIYAYIYIYYEVHPESKECLRIQSTHLFRCSLSLIYDVHVVSAEIAVAMICRLRIPATMRCEVLFVFYRPMRS